MNVIGTRAAAVLGKALEVNTCLLELDIGVRLFSQILVVLMIPFCRKQSLDLERWNWVLVWALTKLSPSWKSMYYLYSLLRTLL